MAEETYKKLVRLSQEGGILITPSMIDGAVRAGILTKDEAKEALAGKYNDRLEREYGTRVVSPCPGTIANLTQHSATPEQKEQGVKDLSKECQEELKKLLTFEEMPTLKEVEKRASEIVFLLQRCEPCATKAMVGGAPYLMCPLENKLIESGIVPMYAFSKREVVEEIGPDGEVVKKSIFRHKGFISLKEKVERALEGI